MIAKAPETLLEFFEWHFVPGRLMNTSPRNRSNYRLALNIFKKYLEHAPLLDDLNAENLALWTDYLTARSYSAKTIRVLGCTLRSVWREAFVQGLVAAQPPAPKPRQRKSRSREARPPRLTGASPGALRQFFDQVFDLEQLASMSSKTRRRYIQSLDRFDRFLERPAQFEDIEETTLIDFMAWLQEKGYEPSSTADTRRALQAIKAFRAYLEIAEQDEPAAERGVLAPTMTLNQYLGNVYTQRRLLKDKSVYQYQTAVNSISAWYGEPLPVRDLSRDLVNSWLRHLLAGPNAPATVQNRRRHLLTLWIAAHRDGLVDYQSRDTLTVPAPWVPPKAWTWEQVQGLLDTAESLRGDYPSCRWLANERDRMRQATFWGIVIRLAWDTGLRGCDLFDLTPRMLAPDRTIELAQRKTGRWHITKVHEETQAKILASFPPDRATIIPWNLSQEHFRREFSAIVKAAGLRGTFKTIRKSSATEVELHYPGCGAAHLGHVQPGDIARRNYLDPKLLIENRPMPRPLRTLPAGIESKGAG